MNKLIATAGKLGRRGHRDKTLMHINRRKNGTPSTRPLGGTEIWALRKLKHDSQRLSTCPSPSAKARYRLSGAKLIARAGQAAGFDFPVHPHMLRHACGFKLANDGQDTRAIQHYLGHKNIQHTVRYTELAPGRFKGFWED